MEPGNPDTGRVQSRPLNCHAEACPAEGFLGAFLGNGGCIFCRAGQCMASPLTLSLFSIAGSTQAIPYAVEAQDPIVAQLAALPERNDPQNPGCQSE
jgi:hypothetical protein